MGLGWGDGSPASDVLEDDEDAVVADGAGLAGSWTIADEEAGGVDTASATAGSGDARG